MITDTYSREEGRITDAYSREGKERITDTYRREEGLQKFKLVRKDYSNLQ